jgi:hypothetical protein
LLTSAQSADEPELSCGPHQTRCGFSDVRGFDADRDLPNSGVAAHWDATRFIPDLLFHKSGRGDEIQ